MLLTKNILATSIFSTTILICSFYPCVTIFISGKAKSWPSHHNYQLVPLKTGILATFHDISVSKLIIASTL